MALAEMGNSKLHLLFLPYFTPSHMIPQVNAARIFASHGLKVTIIATPANADLFQSSIDEDTKLGHDISIHIIPFPADEVGLPNGVENFNAATSIEMLGKLMKALFMLQKPIEDLILKINPHCLFSDRLFPWTIDVTEKLKIPRFSSTTSIFHHCVKHSLETHLPHRNIGSETESFFLPGLPDKIELKKCQIEDYGQNSFGDIIERTRDADRRSHGMIYDTFFELEPGYAEYMEKATGKQSWSIGPLFLFSDQLGKRDVDIKHSCLDWLDTQEQSKVLYICFGSLAKFPEAQLKEIALAIESSDCPFIWVVRNQENEQDWFPKGFEEKMIKSGKGLIIKKWAPQLKILNHPSIGGFMTHSGWNSVLESVSAGVPMITWPLFSEQFYNDKFVGAMEFGVRVGVEKVNVVPVMITTPLVESKQIQEAIQKLMCKSGKSERIREKVKEMAAMAKAAVEEGGSSYENVKALIQVIKASAFGEKN
ncbi:hypothetical protein M9H77_19422 [Catharanthus roseus]|uniref:Uncharacterized protein n=1 Tax=Catharanthus roseus TaxID=4058 RepID=A0ACC0BA91_CATRO|nr:hypothetical protein M9H77_19422 [Catharanthus roseus]